jgi:hypothetical protein
MHFSSQNVIKKICLTYAHSLNAFLTDVGCLKTKHDHRIKLTKLPTA